VKRSRDEGGRGPRSLLLSSLDLRERMRPSGKIILLSEVRDWVRSRVGGKDDRTGPSSTSTEWKTLRGTWFPPFILRVSSGESEAGAGKGCTGEGLGEGLLLGGDARAVLDGERMPVVAEVAFWRSLRSFSSSESFSRRVFFSLLS